MNRNDVEAGEQKEYPQVGMSTVNPMADFDDEITVVENENVDQKKNLKITKIGMAIGLAIVATFVIIGLSTSSPVSEAQDSSSDSNPAGEEIGNPSSNLPRTAFVHLFEWKWNDIKRECVEFLGPKGFSAVQVSPPNEHIDHKSVQDFAWWARYQPVSYRLESRSGTRQEFIDMVNTCKSVGVDIYADAVINHMAAHGVGRGNAGSTYNGLNFPDFGYNDFNHCNPPDIQGSDYSNDAYRVKHCNLVGLPDLNQDSSYVKQKIISYLKDLTDIGVAGFRFDASKHMEPYDIDQIVDGAGNSPYVFLEVIDLGGEAVSKYDYNLGKEDITEFVYSKRLGEVFAYEKLDYLSNFGESWGMLPSSSAVVFVDNHDNQRGHGSAAQVTHRSGALYDIANVFMLAWPYGYPKVMSSYDWGGDNDNRGPPHNGNGDTSDVYNSDGTLNCFYDKWKCEHRYRPIANMVGFRNFAASVGAFDIRNWWSNGNNQIAFTRSNGGNGAGFVAINREGYDLNQNFNTGLSDGNYCDIVSGEYFADSNQCTGTIVSVNGGYANIFVKPYYSLAIHGGTKMN